MDRLYNEWRYKKEPSKIVKGGFRATLALILSILALVVSLLAYSAAGNDKQLKTHIAELQAAIERMKSESSRELGDLRNETAKALEELSQAVKKEDKSRESAGRGISPEPFVHPSITQLGSSH